MLADRGDFANLEELAQRTVVERLDYRIEAQRQDSSEQDIIPAGASLPMPGRITTRTGASPLGTGALAPAFACSRLRSLASLCIGQKRNSAKG